MKEDLRYWVMNRFLFIMNSFQIGLMVFFGFSQLNSTLGVVMYAFWVVFSVLIVSDVLVESLERFLDGLLNVVVNLFLTLPISIVIFRTTSIEEFSLIPASVLVVSIIGGCFWQILMVINTMRNGLGKGVV